MSLNVDNILIIGLGMIGSSIALASKSKGINVTGFDLDDETLKKAINEKIIDSKIESIEKINQKDKELVILAVPPK
jgi:Prephenate dehydrogenase